MYYSVVAILSTSIIVDAAAKPKTARTGRGGRIGKSSGTSKRGAGAKIPAKASACPVGEIVKSLDKEFNGNFNYYFQTRDGKICGDAYWLDDCPRIYPLEIEKFSGSAAGEYMFVYDAYSDKGKCKDYPDTPEARRIRKLAPCPVNVVLQKKIAIVDNFANETAYSSVGAECSHIDADGLGFPVGRGDSGKTYSSAGYPELGDLPVPAIPSWIKDEKGQNYYTESFMIVDSKTYHSKRAAYDKKRLEIDEKRETMSKECETMPTGCHSANLSECPDVDPHAFWAKQNKCYEDADTKYRAMLDELNK